SSIHGSSSPVLPAVLWTQTARERPRSCEVSHSRASLKGGREPRSLLPSILHAPHRRPDRFCDLVPIGPRVHVAQKAHAGVAPHIGGGPPAAGAVELHESAIGQAAARGPGIEARGAEFRIVAQVAVGPQREVAGELAALVGPSEAHIIGLSGVHAQRDLHQLPLIVAGQVPPCRAYALYAA